MKQLKKLRVLEAKEAWLGDAIRFAENRLPKVIHKVPHDGDAAFVKFGRGVTLLAGRGVIPPHTDPTFGPYLYLLILKADDAVLTADGFLPMPLKAGQLVELYVRKLHDVGQPHDNTLIWHHVEAARPRSLERVLRQARQELASMGVVHAS